MRKSSTKRKVLVISLIVAIIAIMSMGSLAWFSATDTVQNDLTFKSFGIDVYEIDADDEEIGKNLLDEGGIEFDGILPGQKCEKNVTVQNTGEYDAFIRVQVTITNYEAWSTIYEDHGGDYQIAVDLFGATINPNGGWYCTVDDYVVDADEDTITFTYYTNEILEPEEETLLFETVDIPAWLTKEDLGVGVTFDEQTGEPIQPSFEFSIIIEADAIQTEYLVDASGNELDTTAADACKQAFALLG